MKKKHLPRLDKCFQTVYVFALKEINYIYGSVLDFLLRRTELKKSWFVDSCIEPRGLEVSAEFGDCPQLSKSSFKLLAVGDVVDVHCIKKGPLDSRSYEVSPT